MKTVKTHLSATRYNHDKKCWGYGYLMGAMVHLDIISEIKLGQVKEAMHRAAPTPHVVYLTKTTTGVYLTWKYNYVGKFTTPNSDHTRGSVRISAEKLLSDPDYINTTIRSILMGFLKYEVYWKNMPRVFRSYKILVKRLTKLLSEERKELHFFNPKDFLYEFKMNWLQKLENSKRSDGSLERLVKSRMWEINELCEKYGVDTSEVFMTVKELDTDTYFVLCVKHVLEDANEFPVLLADNLSTKLHTSEDDCYCNVHMSTYTLLTSFLPAQHRQLLSSLSKKNPDNSQKLKQSSPCGEIDRPRSLSNNSRFLGEFEYEVPLIRMSNDPPDDILDHKRPRAVENQIVTIYDEPEVSDDCVTYLSVVRCINHTPATTTTEFSVADDNATEADD